MVWRVLITREQVYGLLELALPVFLRETLAAIDVTKDVLLARSLEGAPGGLHLRNELFAIFGIGGFQKVAQCSNLSFGAIEAIDDVLL